jgi:DNA-binding CsgD family transcriptional regulator
MQISVSKASVRGAPKAGSMADEPDPSLCIGDGGPLSLSSLARIDLDPATFHAFYEARERFDLDTREHLLARITPREREFIEHVCLHPEQSDEEIMAALGLRKSTLLAYYAHLARNFHVHSGAELRRWAIENGLVSQPPGGPVNDPPEDLPEDLPKDPPDPGFDRWVRWY